MNLKEVIRAEKTGLDTGRWAQGHIPRANFPMSKNKDKNYKYGLSFSWRLIRFSALGAKFRILLILNEGKEKFSARLGLEQNGDMIVLCDHEFHSSEPGWHCHFTSKDVSSLEPGVARTGRRRRPKMADSSAVFTVTKANAVSIAAKRFGLEVIGVLL